ncbi:MAG: FAD-dependent oxidoreductase, partial [Acidobacteriota bacterium]
YAGQGHYDRAAEIYAQVVSEAPEREDLKQKYGEAMTHVGAPAETQDSAALRSQQVVPLLEAWRGAFRSLKGERVDPLRLLEAWRGAFEKLKGVQIEPRPLLEAWLEAFRKLKVRQGETG